MRFMMFIYPNPETETDYPMPSAEEVAVMMKFNQQMLDAGVMLTGEGLHPTSKGARVRFKNGRPQVTDGPFTETKEVLGGYWMLQVHSKEEAIEWAKRVPIEDERALIELRQVFDMEDFPPDVQQAAGFAPTADQEK
ncbi:MAG: YciI family protein [Nitrolancea sp.]